MFVQIPECCNHCCELLREFRSVYVDLCNLGSSRSFGILDGLPVLYCLKSGTCRMTSNDGRPLLSQCKMVGSATQTRQDELDTHYHESFSYSILQPFSST